MPLGANPAYQDGSAGAYGRYGDNLLPGDRAPNLVIPSNLASQEINEAQSENPNTFTQPVYATNATAAAHLLAPILENQKTYQSMQEVGQLMSLKDLAEQRNQQEWPNIMARNQVLLDNMKTSGAIQQWQLGEDQRETANKLELPNVLPQVQAKIAAYMPKAAQDPQQAYVDLKQMEADEVAQHAGNPLLVAGIHAAYGQAHDQVADVIKTQVGANQAKQVADVADLQRQYGPPPDGLPPEKVPQYYYTKDAQAKWQQMGLPPEKFAVGYDGKLAQGPGGAQALYDQAALNLTSVQNIKRKVQEQEAEEGIGSPKNQAAQALAQTKIVGAEDVAYIRKTGTNPDAATEVVPISQDDKPVLKGLDDRIRQLTVANLSANPINQSGYTAGHYWSDQPDIKSANNKALGELKAQRATLLQKYGIDPSAPQAPVGSRTGVQSQGSAATQKPIVPLAPVMPGTAGTPATATTQSTPATGQPAAVTPQLQGATPQIDPAAVTDIESRGLAAGMTPDGKIMQYQPKDVAGYSRQGVKFFGKYAAAQPTTTTVNQGGGGGAPETQPEPQQDSLVNPRALRDDYDPNAPQPAAAPVDPAEMGIQRIQQKQAALDRQSKEQEDANATTRQVKDASDRIQLLTPQITINTNRVNQLNKEIQMANDRIDQANDSGTLSALQRQINTLKSMRTLTSNLLKDQQTALDRYTKIAAVGQQPAVASTP